MILLIVVQRGTEPGEALQACWQVPTHLSEQEGYTYAARTDVEFARLHTTTAGRPQHCDSSLSRCRLGEDGISRDSMTFGQTPGAVSTAATSSANEARERK